MELVCERTWRRADWRAKHSIPWGAPCLGILCHSTISPPVHSIVQELQWIIPGIRVALVSDPNEPLTSPTAWGAFGVERFQRSDHRNDPLHVLEWICGADAWLIVDTTPLAQALKRITTELRSPCFSVSSSIRRVGALGWDELTRQIARSFESGFNHPTAVAFRNPTDPLRQHRGMTVDAALQLLGAALNQTDTRSSKSEMVPVPQRLPDKAPLRRAA